MKIRPLPFLMPVASVLLLLVMACSEQASDSNPDAQSTNASTEMSASSGSAPTAVPVSAELVTEFSAAQDSINADWDELHVDFDRWRGNLSACDRTAALAAMRVFASDFGQVAEQARALPGKGIARELPDNVILAANSEEASLRLLRDTWLPGDVSLLENTQTERATAAGLIRATAIEVDKLEELDKPEDQEVAEDFADALAPVDEAWDAFNDSYGALEDDHIDLSVSEIVTRLRVLIDEHEAVLESLEDIPSDKVTDAVQDQLVEAAEAESEALDDLLDAFRREARAADSGNGAEDSDSAAQNGNGNGDGNGGTASSENGPEASSEESAESVEEGTEGSTGSPQGTAGNHERGTVGLGQVTGQTGPDVQGGVTGIPTFFTGLPTGLTDPTTAGQQAGPDSSEDEESGAEEADYSAYFDTFEDTLDQTKVTRKQAGRELEAIIEGVSEDDKEALAEFTSAFADLMDDWNNFHAEFDRWVRTEGNCNRASAVEELHDFNQQFSELGNRVRELSQVSYLRPSSDLLAEAIDREGAALRGLASTWAPYESDVYRGLDDERANAVNLRRLADRRTQELIERNGMVQ